MSLPECSIQRRHKLQQLIANAAEFKSFYEKGEKKVNPDNAAPEQAPIKNTEWRGELP